VNCLQMGFAYGFRRHSTRRLLDRRGSIEGVPSSASPHETHDESVMIGDDVMITVLGVKGNQVRIGIDAPKHVAVHREEIFERVKARNAWRFQIPEAIKRPSPQWRRTAKAYASALGKNY